LKNFCIQGAGANDENTRDRSETPLELFLPGGGLWLTPMLRAQVVNDGATATLANVTNTLTGTVTVGTNGAFTSFTVADNALLTNSIHGVIGRNAPARSNEVQWLSATARWRMGGDLSVGSNGSFNRLVVSNGARAENFIGSLATGVASSNNLALVTGSGSIWSNRTDVWSLATAAGSSTWWEARSVNWIITLVLCGEAGSASPPGLSAIRLRLRIILLPTL
jgi:hypothetical protein